LRAPLEESNYVHLELYSNAFFYYLGFVDEDKILKVEDKGAYREVTMDSISAMRWSKFPRFSTSGIFEIVGDTVKIKVRNPYCSLVKFVKE